MVGLAGRMLVQVPEVNSAPGATIMLSNHHHSALPTCRSIEGNTFQNPKFEVPIKTLLDSQLPVKGDLGGDMNSNWWSLGVNMKLERWGA